MPRSLLDTDLYKLTMQQAVLHHFPDAKATYRFTHRDKSVFFNRGCIEQFRAAVNEFSELALTGPELEWLRVTCPFFKPSYLDYLSAYRFNPSQVHIKFVPMSPDGECGNVEIEAIGPWKETILWEVPLMACLSEIYYQVVMTDWSYEGQAETAYLKAQKLLNAGCAFSEFGTRRRRSFHAQDLVLENLLRASRDIAGNGTLVGTSNVYLAFKYGIKPVGTIAHEWFMGVAAMKGYENANIIALALWEEVYPDGLMFALTDTFSTEAFLKCLVADPDRARRWKGLRQDSGDPFVFAPRVRDVYHSLGIDHREKCILYSDALDTDRCLELKRQCDSLGFQASFGIGTSLTNDFYTLSSSGKFKSRALNIVIKIADINDKPCVKISDDFNKSTGDPATIQRVKDLFKLS